MGGCEIGMACSSGFKTSCLPAWNASSRIGQAGHGLVWIPVCNWQTMQRSRFEALDSSCDMDVHPHRETGRECAASPSKRNVKVAARKIRWCNFISSTGAAIWLKLYLLMATPYLIV